MQSLVVHLTLLQQGWCLHKISVVILCGEGGGGQYGSAFGTIFAMLSIACSLD